MSTKQLNMRLDENLINEVKPILSGFGLSVADACRIFLNKVVMEDGIPFDLKNKEKGYTPNEETRRAILYDERIDVGSVEELLGQYDNQKY